MKQSKQPEAKVCRRCTDPFIEGCPCAEQARAPNWVGELLALIVVVLAFLSMYSAHP